VEPLIEGEYGPNGVNLGEEVAREGEDCAGESGRGVDWEGERALAVDKVGRCKGSRGRLWGLLVKLAVVLGQSWEVVGVVGGVGCRFGMSVVIVCVVRTGGGGCGEGGGEGS